MAGWPIALAEGSPTDRVRPPTEDAWIRRARPAFLYVMYAVILGCMPIAVIAAFHPVLAEGIARAVGAYLHAIPEPLWALFGTGYLGYTAARTWGKVRGVEK